MFDHNETHTYNTQLKSQEQPGKKRRSHQVQRN